jgi:hypothetical protein
MKPSSLSELLASCPVADEALWQKHVDGFVTFIASAKKERWHEQLTKRPRRIFQHSHKLHSDLDRRVCKNVGQWLTEDMKLKGEGVYYDFYNPPRVVPVELLLNRNVLGDAIYSLIPGELAIYFFHEGEVWLCQARKRS